MADKIESQESLGPLPDDLVEGRYAIDDMTTVGPSTLSVSDFEISGEGERAGVLSTWGLRPNSTLVVYVNGPPGDSVSMLLDFEGGSNGHNHSGGTSDPRVVGACSPRQFTLGPYPQNVAVTYRSTNFCGLVKLTTRGNSGSDIDYFRVKFPGLASLPPHPNIRAYQNDTTHPQSHYGRQDLITAIHRCATAFGQEFPGDRLWINDMSLPWGGVFDIGGTHTAPHSGHKWGGEVDISYNLQTGAQRQWFRNNAGYYFTRVLLHGNPLHWHCSIF